MSKSNQSIDDLFKPKDFDKLETRFGFQGWIILVLVGITIWQFTKISDLEKEQSQIKSEISIVHSNIIDIQSSMDNMESTDDELDGRVQGLEDDYDDVESRISNLE